MNPGMLVGELVVPLVVILLIVGKAKKGSINNVLLVLVVTAIALIIEWTFGIAAIVGNILIGLVGVIMIYTKKEPEKINKLR